MQFTETILFYLLIGLGVAAGVWLNAERAAFGDRAFRGLSAILFWPIFVPVLLKPAEMEEAVDGVATPAVAAVPDEMSAAIAGVEAELDSALKSLDDWSGDVLAHECGQIDQLRAAWRAQAQRIRELDHLLTQPEFTAADRTLAGEESSTAANVSAQSNASERMLQSETARQENIVRLRSIRRQLYDDLMGTLAWVRELVTMIHLAKFTGAPASRAEELVSQIAAAVEGLSEVCEWREEALARAV